MILSDLLFDALMFGALVLAVVCDALVPASHGSATLVVLGFFLYLAAEDGAEIARRAGWGQESLASGVALSTFGFIYFWWRNDSDVAATALHICLMLSALMALIGVVAALAAAFHERSARPLIGLLATVGIAFALGALGGAALLFLTGGASLVLKLAVVAASLVAWRLRVQKGGNAATSTVENGPDAKKDAAQKDAKNTVAEDAALAASRILRPHSRLALDRLAPLLVIGALAFAGVR